MRVSPQSLRVFEAVARLQSFTRAAQDLFVTQSAVSQQVSQLETRLGKKLLERRGRALKLTADGETLFDACRRGFALLDAGVERVAESDSANRLRIKVPPTLAMKWLMPRLPRFQVQHPTVQISLSTSVTPADFEVENIDISALRASAPDPLYHCVPIFEERLMLVCSPKLWGRRRTVASMSGMTVLHTVTAARTGACGRAKPAPPMCNPGVSLSLVFRCWSTRPRWRAWAWPSCSQSWWKTSWPPAG